MAVIIRETFKDDINDLAQLVLEFRKEHTQMLGGKCTLTLDEAVEEVKEHLDKEDSGYFVAVDSLSNQLIGFRRWELHEGFYFTRELYIIPDMRRQGIAKALIRHFEKWVLEKGQNIACISCVPHNVAMIMLARSEGYEILNMIEMRKDLTGKTKKPRSQTDALGLRWKLL